MYDRGKELTFKHFRDIGFLAAMGKVGKMRLCFSFQDGTNISDYEIFLYVMVAYEHLYWRVGIEQDLYTFCRN